MALQTLEAGYVPFPLFLTAVQFTTGASLTVDAATERMGVVLRVPKTGTVDKFAARISTVTNAPDNGLRFSFQGITMTTGQPDGGVDQFATVASGSVIAGWLDPGTFDAGRAVTRGDLLACVIDFASFVAGDSVLFPTLGVRTSGFPYTVGPATTGKDPLDQLSIALHYDDGTWALIDGVYPTSAVPGAISYNLNTAVADEWGLAFSVPFPCKAVGLMAAVLVAADADYEALLYDSDGSTVLGTSGTMDGNVVGTNSHGWHTVLFTTDVTLVANTLYRIALRPTTTSSLNLSYVPVPNGDLLRYCFPGGDNVYLTSRLNQAGAWTDYNNGTDGYRVAPVSVLLSAFDDAVGGGSTEHSHVFAG